jgi:hypothetical protein
VNKIVEYLIPLTNDTQLRHVHTHWKNKVAGFTVQLEVYVENKWQPIVRYDTAHGFAHKDIMHANGAKDKIPLYISDFKEALNFSDKDLKANWRIYREQFLSAIGRFASGEKELTDE